MEKKFTSDEVPLAQLLDEARSGKLQLPDFQRGWVWDDDHIASLLASISLSYPIGAVMTLQTGNPDVRFRPRPLQGVTVDGTIDPEVMLLDGQQRMTSLYLALRSAAPVPTRDSKGKAMKRQYFIDINGSLDPFVDREDAIKSVPEDGILKVFGGGVVLDVSSRKTQIAAEHFPLGLILDYSETMSWQLAYLESGPGENQDRLEKWKKFNERVINPFVQYQVPTIQLVKSTPKEAVCQVFEKVNTGGVSLTVFELLTATYAADDFNLRDDWHDRRSALSAHTVLEKVAATDFLQVITLLATRERRLAHIKDNPTDDRVPAVSCKRKDVLKLELADYRKWAAVAGQALARVVPHLHGEYIFDAKDLPYATQLVPLAAAFAVLGDGAEGHAARQKLRQWYWCGVFGEMYGGSTETRFALDLQDLASWVEEDGEEPRTVRDAQFQADRLLTLQSRQSAAYKGLLALQMKRGGRDFRTGNRVDIHAYIDDAIDIHHIFPRKWCDDQNIASGLADCAVNKTAIDAKTNQRIGGAAPSKYLASIETKEGIQPGDLDEMLQSHDIDAAALRENDFPTFFNRRFERLLKQIEVAMGKPTNRSADRSESPYSEAAHDTTQIGAGVEALIAAGESKVVEFKATGRKNLATDEKDPNMEWAVVKTLAGFMNANGGTLLVGVADDGALHGIEDDFPFLKSPDVDAWEQWLTDLVATSTSKTAASELTVELAMIGDRTVARIDVGPGPGPVFARMQKVGKSDIFMVRINNTTVELAGQDMLDYQKKRWPA